MLTGSDRAAVAVVNELVRKYVYRLPVDVAALCRVCGARLMPLSELTEGGMARSAVFAVWGNPDGVAMSSGRRWTIGYNDRTAPNRIRFTMAEELMHLLLGHTEDRRFALARQSYDEESYQRYETEAKRAAGMLLLPPSVYFRYRSVCAPAAIARLCRISESCERSAARWYEENEDELRALFTAKPIVCDTHGLARRFPLRPIPVERD